MRACISFVISFHIIYSIFRDLHNITKDNLKAVKSDKCVDGILSQDTDTDSGGEFKDSYQLAMLDPRQKSNSEENRRLLKDPASEDDQEHLIETGMCVVCTCIVSLYLNFNVLS